MPSFACTKFKCRVQDGTRACTSCLARQERCSYLSTSTSTSTTTDRRPSGLVADLDSKAPSLHSLRNHGQHANYTVTNTESGLDIGGGSPAEILREGELTSSLLRLYFSNFADVNFMFDQDVFMRRYALGEAPKMLLFAMMALGIKYTHAPFADQVARSHRGEILFDHARNLLKDEFDHASLTTAQTYVLLCTYHLTFGGSRKAWISLSTAYTIVRSLKLMDDSLEEDPLQADVSRRLIGTIALMDRLVSPSIKMPNVIASEENVPDIYSNVRLRSLRHHSISALKGTSLDLMQHTLVLSSIFQNVCSSIRQSIQDFRQAQLQLDEWSSNLPDALTNTPANFDSHQKNFLLRQFAFMHVLYHHIQQLCCFHSLAAGHTSHEQHRDTCYHHASKLIDTVSWVDKHAGIVLHNASIGQCLTIAAVVQIHKLLSSTISSEIVACQERLQTINAYFLAVKQHCRLFGMIAAQLDTFQKICSLTYSPDIFADNVNLLNQMLHLGTRFEQLDYSTASRLEGLEAAFTQNTETYVAYMNADASRLLAPDFLSQRMRKQNADKETVPSVSDFGFDEYAWIFTNLSQSQPRSQIHDVS